MDPILRRLGDDTEFRVLGMVDLHTHECVWLVLAVRLRADTVVTAFNQLRDERVVLAVNQCDSDTKFTSIALDIQCYWNQAHLDFSYRGKTTDSAAIKGF